MEHLGNLLNVEFLDHLSLRLIDGNYIFWTLENDFQLMQSILLKFENYYIIYCGNGYDRRNVVVVVVVLLGEEGSQVNGERLGSIPFFRLS